MQKDSGYQGLFIQNDKFKKDMSLYLKSNVEGLRYFQNSYDDLNSFQKRPALRFENSFADSAMGYDWSASSIKIVDDIAAVSYGNYTDINKTVVRLVNGGLYGVYLSGYGGSSTDCNVTTYTRHLSNSLVLPNFNIRSFDNTTPSGNYAGIHSRMNQDNSDIDFSGVYIIVEHDGYYTNSDGDIVSRELTNGRFEVFKYSPVPTESIGFWYYTDYCRHPFLNSKYNTDDVTSNFYSGIPNTRLQEDQVELHDVEMFGGIMNDFSLNVYTATCVRLGFLGYKSITFVKYTPVIKCGRVDLYVKKTGEIVSCSDNYFYSPNHNLNDGDIIEIASTCENGVSVLNGLRYVIRANKDNILIFEDPEMSRQLSNLNIRSANFTCVGSLDSGDYQGWNYSKTIYSPTGRNGQCQTDLDINEDASNAYHIYDNSNTKPLHKKFQDCATFDDIARKDFLDNLNPLDPINSATDMQILDPFFTDLEVRNRVSSLDCMWSNHEHFAHSYRFGCDIDMKDVNGQIYLLVGERGADEIVSYADHYFPYNHPYGRIHLLQVSKVSGEISISSNRDRTFDASSGDSEISNIIVGPEQFNICDNTFFRTGIQDTYSITKNPYIFLQPNTYYFADTIDGYLDGIFNNDYWYGSMVLHRGIVTEYTVPTGTGEDEDIVLVPEEPTNWYSSDSYDPSYYFLYNLDDQKKYFAYCDSFGKSVCLQNIGTNIICHSSSKTKINLIPPMYRRVLASTPPNSLYSAIDNGYVHSIKWDGAPTKISKITKYETYNSISGSYHVQQYCGERYANTIRSINSKIFVGDSMSPDFGDTSGIMPLMQKSRITSYDVSLTSVTYDKTIYKPEDFSPFYPATYYGVSLYEKEDLIKGTLSTPLPGKKIYPSDRFGEHFEISEHCLVTNALSNLNDSGSTHDSIATGNQVIDFFYIANLDIKMTLRFEGVNIPGSVLLQCVERPGRPGYYYVVTTGLPLKQYEIHLIIVATENHLVATDVVNINATYGVFYPDELNDETANNTSDGADAEIVYGSTLITDNTPENLFDYLFVYNFDENFRAFYQKKISCSFDSSSSKYSYLTLSPDYHNSYNSIGNKTYSNSTTNSVTVDDLYDDSYLIIDDRILLRDRYGFAVFSKGSDYDCIYDIVIQTPSGQTWNNRLTYLTPVLGYGDTKSYVYRSGALTSGYGVVMSENFSSEYSFDFGQKDSLSLFLEVGNPIDLDANLYQFGAESVSGLATMFQRGTVGETSEISLFLGPTVASGDINLTTLVSNLTLPTTTTGDSNLVIANLNPSVTFQVSLFEKCTDFSEPLSLFILPPIPKSDDVNLSLKAHVFYSNLLCDDPELFIQGGNIFNEVATLFTRGLVENGLSLYILGPANAGTDVNLVLDSIRQNTTNDFNLFIHAPTVDTTTLYIAGHDITTQDASLYLDCTPRAVDSNNNGGIFSCYFAPGTTIFDITQGAEMEIDGVNSICQQKYSSTGAFGYIKPTLLPNEIKTDYEFYRYGRFKKLIDSNDDYIVIGSGSGFFIFRKRLGQAEYVNYVEVPNRRSSGLTKTLVELLDIKISPDNKIAFSYYQEFSRNIDSQKFGEFRMSIYSEIDNPQVYTFRRFFEFTNDSYLANFAYASLCWGNDGRLYFNKEEGYEGTVKYVESSELYATEYLACKLSGTIGGFDLVEKNWMNGVFNYSRWCFGHRIIFHKEFLYVSSPLWSDALNIVYPDNTRRAHNFNGAVYVFDDSFAPYNTYSLLDDECPHNFYGYDIDLGDTQTFITSISPPRIYSYNTALGTLVRVDESDDYSFCMSIEACDNSIYTILGDRAYSVKESQYVTYSNQISEVQQYLPYNSLITQSNEYSAHIHSYGGYVYLFRYFDVIHGVGTETTIKKLSKLQSYKNYGDPSLFIKNNGLVENLNLHLNTVVPQESNINFFTGASDSTTGLISCFIENVPDGQMWSNLVFRIGIDPIPNSSDATIFVRGNASPGFFYSEGLSTLIMEGGPSRGEDSMPLKIEVSLITEVNNLMPLHIRNNTEWEDFSGSTNILITGSGNSMYGQVISGNRNLIIKGSDITSGSMPLFLSKTGVGGGQEAGENVQMHLLNKSGSDGVSIYSSGINGGNGVLYITIPNTVGSSRGTSTIFTRGFEE